MDYEKDYLVCNLPKKSKLHIIQLHGVQKYMDVAKVTAKLLPNAVPTLFMFGPSPISYKRKIISSETAEDANLEIRPNVLKKPMKSEFNEHGYCYNFPKSTNDDSEDTSDKGN